MNSGRRAAVPGTATAQSVVLGGRDLRPAKTDARGAWARWASDRRHESRRGARITTATSLVGVKLVWRTSNWVGEILCTPSPQKLTRLAAAPLSTTMRKSPMGAFQLAPDERMYSIRCSVSWA